MAKIQSYEEFWPYYLSEHKSSRTKAFHFVGTSISLILVLISIVLMDYRFFLVALVTGYGPAWVSHFFIEKNRPATFTYPLWSLRADFRMWWRLLLGRNLP